MSVGDRALARALVIELGHGKVIESFGQHTVQVPVDVWVQAGLVARDVLGASMFDHLSVHDDGGPVESGRGWGVVAHVVVPEGCAGLLLRTTLTGAVALPSLTGVWAGAAWHEREAAEMAGIDVSGHPDLRPLLLAPGAGLHPLRKDVLLVSRAVRSWPGRMEPGESRREDHGATEAQPAAGRRRASAPGVAPEGWGEQ